MSELKLRPLEEMRRAFRAWALGAQDCCAPTKFSLRPPNPASCMLACRDYCRQLTGCFSPAVDEEEKCGEADEQQRSAEHPHFVRHDRSDLLCWKEGQRDTKYCGHEPAHSREEKHGLAVAAFDERLVGGNLEQRAEHVQERHELEHHRQR